LDRRGDCRLCEENERQLAGACAGAVAELDTGFVRLHPRQRYRGQAFFVSRACVREPYHLEPEVHLAHFEELAEVTAALDAAFGSGSP
jgi:hypothetical protein